MTTLPASSGVLAWRCNSVDKIRRSPLYDVALGTLAVMCGVFVAACLIVGIAVVLARIAEVAT
jgi:hypothetical protein